MNLISIVKEKNYSDTVWELNLWLEKDDERVAFERGFNFMGIGFGGWMDLAALTQNTPAEGVAIYSLYPDLTDKKAWQDIIREYLNDLLN